MVEGAVLHELAAQVQAGRWEGEREMEGLGLREREVPRSGLLRVFSKNLNIGLFFKPETPFREIEGI